MYSFGGAFGPSNARVDWSPPRQDLCPAAPGVAVSLWWSGDCLGHFSENGEPGECRRPPNAVIRSLRGKPLPFMNPMRRAWTEPNDPCRGAPVSHQTLAALQLTRAESPSARPSDPEPDLMAAVSRLAIHEAWEHGTESGRHLRFRAPQSASWCREVTESRFSA